MADFTATRPHLYVAGAVILASNHTNNETTLYTKFNASIHATTGHLHDGSTGNGTILRTMPTLVPIGTIIPFYDFNGGLTFNTTYWAYCNGQSKTVGSLGAQTLPDLSGRYLVGFGTDGGADNGSAAWATSLVGNAAHQIDLQHTHTVASHTHDVDIASTTTSSGGAHTHTVASHTHDLANHTHAGAAHTHTLSNHTHIVSSHSHGPGTLVFCVGSLGNTTGSAGVGTLTMFKSSGASIVSIVENQAVRAAGGSQVAMMNTGNHGDTLLYTQASGVNSSGTSGADAPSTGNPSSNTSGSTTPGASDVPSTNTSGSASPATDSQGAHTHTVDPVSTTSTAATPATDAQLSTTQSIQPRSIRVRYLMRIL